MGVIIDTNIFIGWEKRREDSHVIDEYLSKESFISVITVSELLHGVHRAQSASIQAKRLAFVESVISHCPVIQIDTLIARMHAQISAKLTIQGQMIGVHDSWIAASCLAYGHDLMTFNLDEFTRIPGLNIINIS